MKQPCLFLKTLLAAALLSTLLPARMMAQCGDGICNGPTDCDMDCGAFCGDGICNGVETSSSCSYDCVPPPPPTCTVDTCDTCSRSSVINDGDSIPDALEYDLAHAFFPAILLKNVDTDLGEAYPYLGKAIPFTVEALPVQGICNEAYKCLEIRYGIAYRYDHGDSLASGHPGDSEFYAVLVMRTQSWPIAQGSAGYWQMVRDFTAAHWSTSVDSSVYGAYGSCPANCSGYTSSTSCEQQPACDWSSGYCTGFGGGDLGCYGIRYENECYAYGCEWEPAYCYQAQPVTCYSSVPSPTYATLYSSEKKHALYHTDWECDHGGWLWPWGEGEDECPNTGLYSLRDFKGGLLQNVGNKTYKSPDIKIQHPDMCAPYDVWGRQYFGGKTTPYYDHFVSVLKWGLAVGGCGEASCVPVQGTYISHFTGAGCTGTESYYLPYDGFAYSCRTWNGTGQCGTIHRTVTNRSYRYMGTCYDAWPSGNTLNDFVTVYR